MDELNKWNCLTYLGAARSLGVSMWRIRYAVESGYLAAPSVVLKRRALFSPEQIDGMRRFFEMEEVVKRRKESNAASNSRPEERTIIQSDESQPPPRHSLPPSP